MNIDVAYGRDIDDNNILEQLMYMQADAYAYYESLNSDEKTFIIGAITFNNSQAIQKNA